VAFTTKGRGQPIFSPKTYFAFSSTSSEEEELGCVPVCLIVCLMVAIDLLYFAL
jgi:hypothetical protein